MLDNKVILITGAAGRLGKSLAKNIIQNKGRVVLLDVNSKGLQDFVSELPQDKVLSYPIDASNKFDLNSKIIDAINKFSKIDAAVHSAYPRSDQWGTHFEDLSLEFLSEDLSSQLGGAIIFSQSILKYFLKQGYGNLIHISSIQGIASPKFDHYKGTNMISPIEYSAIKSGIISITRYLAKYYKDKNIRVNCISPGGIIDKQPESFLNKYRKECNIKGMLDPDDISDTVIFLISDKSTYINGQNIIIDDGWSL
tara:strand:+ start:277 stop:1035 length:759 start_codon:yes stop_codon:yes gene_type:complete